MKWETLVLVGVIAYFSYQYYLQQQAQQQAALGYAATIGNLGLTIL